MTQTSVSGNSGFAVLLKGPKATHKTHLLSNPARPASPTPTKGLRACDWFLCPPSLPWRLGATGPALMALYQLFSHPAERGYRAGLCSKAALFLLLATALTYIPPLLVAFRSHGEPAWAWRATWLGAALWPRPALLTWLPNPPCLSQGFG